MECFEARIVPMEMNEIWKIIYVPEIIVKALGNRPKMDVRGTINDVPFQRSLLSDGQGGRFIVTNLAMRRKIRKDVGDLVKLEIEPDEDYKIVILPDYFIEELEAYPMAQKGYDDSPPSSKRWIFQYLTEPKSLEAKANRVLKAIEILERWHLQKIKKSRKAPS
jgi:hypothetical protein